MQRKRLSWSILLMSFLLILMGVVVWSGYRAKHQSALNHDLIAASRAGDPSLVLALLNRGADPNASEDKTPETGWRYLWNILLGHRQSFSGDSPLSQVMPDQYSVAPLGAHQLEIVRILLEHGADPNVKLPDGSQSPSHWWFEAHDDRLLALFLQHGANPNRADAVGNSVLMHTVVMHKEALVHAALSHGARPNQENAKGDTALMWAAYFHDIQMIELLRSSGADVNHKNKNGASALTYAVTNDDRIVGENRPTRSSAELIRERQEAIERLLAAGADPNASDRQACSPFLFALIAADIDVSNMLAQGADVRRAVPLYVPRQVIDWHLVGVDGYSSYSATPGTTPLMFAVVSQHVDLVRRMLAMGADVNARDSLGKTALTYAESSYPRNVADASKIRTLLRNAGAHR